MGNAPIGILVLLTALSLALLAIGLVLHRKGTLRSRGASLVWAIVTVLPVFAGGWLILSPHDTRPMPTSGMQQPSG
jgi:hypothetical protein